MTMSPQQERKLVEDVQTLTGERDSREGRAVRKSEMSSQDDSTAQIAQNISGLVQRLASDEVLIATQTARLGVLSKAVEDLQNAPAPPASTTIDIRIASGASPSLILTDKGGLIQCTSASAVALDIPTNAAVNFPVGTFVRIYQHGAGLVTLTPAGAVILNTRAGLLAMRGQYCVINLIKIDTNEWVAFGDLA